MVNNAGIETRTSVLDTTEEQYDRVLAINLKAAFFGTQLAAQQMISQSGGGRIINLTSVHEEWPMPGNTAYCLSMTSATAGRLVGAIRAEIRKLSPAYFALVMATGVISIAADMSGMRWIAMALFGLNIIAFVVLSVMTLLRIAWYRAEFLRDLHDHHRSVGFFSTAAGTGVLGAQCLIISHSYRAAALLWGLGMALWIVSTYSIFTLLIVNARKPTLSGITGLWLLAVVATQSIAVLSALLASHWGPSRGIEMNFLALSMWLWGGMLYIWMITLIFYRYVFVTFSPGDLEPPYWIDMGAMAISVLGGTMLIRNANDVWFLQSLLPFLEGFTIFFWATATWWLPMLVILFIWRHWYKRLPLAYDPLYWGAVFPLGMYTVCTLEVADVTKLHFLNVIPRVAVYLALASWLLTSIGLAHHILTLLRRALDSTSERTLGQAP